MRIHFNFEHEDEKMTNFRVAEAVINLCKEGWELDAETIAKMILLQTNVEKGGK